MRPLLCLHQSICVCLSLAHPLAPRHFEALSTWRPGRPTRRGADARPWVPCCEVPGPVVPALLSSCAAWRGRACHRGEQG